MITMTKITLKKIQKDCSIDCRILKSTKLTENLHESDVNRWVKLCIQCRPTINAVYLVIEIQSCYLEQER